jgi:uncharacterized membrane protein
MSAATRQVHIAESVAGVSCNRCGTNFLFAGLIAVYAVGRVLEVYPGRVPMIAVVALHVVPPAVFAVVHGSRFYGWRGILVFITIAFAVGNVFENLGVRTGFPFGHYYFTDLMGPKLFVVPVLLGLAYVGMAYLSWTLGRLIMRVQAPLIGWHAITLPLIAAFIMVAWDVSHDPVWSTILHAWVWLQGGAYFGVPLSNFFGWYLTIYVIYQSFALYQRGRSTNHDPLPLSYWRWPVLFYGASAAGNLLLLLPQDRFSVVSDAAGAQWKVSDITHACGLVTIFTMGAFTLLAWERLKDHGDKGVFGPVRRL